MFNCRNDANSRLCTVYFQMIRLYYPEETFFQIFSENMYNFYNVTDKTSEILIEIVHITYYNLEIKVSTELTQINIV
jgi:hypothetical protein